MRLSVVLPNYNHGRYLEKRLPSILNELPEKSELIFIDDCSKDDSVEIASRLAKDDARLNIHVNPQNLGVEGSTNRGVSLACGTYVTGMASDDILVEGALKKCLEALEEYPDVGLCGTLHGYVYDDDPTVHVYNVVSHITTKTYFSPQDVADHMRKYDFYISGILTILKRSSFLRFGGYQKDLASDWFLHRLIALSEGEIFIPEVLGIWRKTNTNYALTFEKDLSKRKRVLLGMLDYLSQEEYKELRERFLYTKTMHSKGDEYFFSLLKSPKHYDFLTSLMKERIKKIARKFMFLANK